MRSSVNIVAAVLLAGCTSPESAAITERARGLFCLAPAPDGDTVALARVIVDAGQGCPSLVTEAGSVAMTARSNPDPARFPVVVCEAVQPFGAAARVEGAAVALPAARRSPERIAVVGDTGCGTWQDCADPAAWPFARLAEQAAGAGPDLVIHVGDYVYRGTPGTIEVNGVKRGTYNAGNYALEDEYCQLRDPYVSQNGAGSSLPDSWEAWRADFFAPAAPLLSRAPGWRHGAITSCAAGQGRAGSTSSIHTRICSTASCAARSSGRTAPPAQSPPVATLSAGPGPAGSSGHGHRQRRRASELP